MAAVMAAEVAVTTAEVVVTAPAVAVVATATAPCVEQILQRRGRAVAPPLCHRHATAAPPTPIKKKSAIRPPEKQNRCADPPKKTNRPNIEFFPVFYQVFEEPRKNVYQIRILREQLCI